MKDKNIITDYKKVHFIGIGGVSVSALAEYAIANGISVSGSDIKASEFTNRLKNLGATISEGHCAKNVRGAELVVYTVAIDENNCEFRYAKNKKLPLFTRSKFLGEIVNGYKNSVAVSGCHGKTTTSTMIASVLTCAKKDPTLFLGGESYDFRNFRLGKSDFLVAEACEYKKSFLDIKPKISVVLNIDDDHLDTYGNLEGVKKAFNQFIQGRIAVVNADDENCTELCNPCMVTFGIKKTANYYATDIKKDGDYYLFSLHAYSRRLGRVKLKTFGEHDIYNALATFATCDLLGISFSFIKQGLENFNGVKRRNEYLGLRNGVKYYADYAHHPKEIRATLSAHLTGDARTLIIFQPHTYSRTKLLLSEFIEVLKDKSPLIIYKTYPAREQYDEQGSASMLYKNLTKHGASGRYYAQNINELIRTIDQISCGVDKVLVLGAGDVYDKVKEIITTKAKKI